MLGHGLLPRRPLLGSADSHAAEKDRWRDKRDRDGAWYGLYKYRSAMFFTGCNIAVLIMRY